MQKKYLEAGEIVSTHGVQGEVKILPWADGPEFLLQFDTFYLDGRPYAVRSARVHKTCVLASLEGIDTPEQGMALRGKRVCIDRTRQSCRRAAFSLPISLDAARWTRTAQSLAALRTC